MANYKALAELVEGLVKTGKGSRPRRDKGPVPDDSVLRSRPALRKLGLDLDQQDSFYTLKGQDFIKKSQIEDARKLRQTLRSEPQTTPGPNASEEEWAAWGDKLGVNMRVTKPQSLGVHDLIHNREVQVPGGLDGTFSLADMFWLKGNNFNPELLDQATHTKLMQKFVRTLQPGGKPAPEDVYNALNFALMSPNAPLTPNQFIAARTRVRNLDELKEVAGAHGNANDLLELERKAGIGSGAKGGMGVQGTAKMSDQAYLAKLAVEKPEIFNAQEGETLRDVAWRVASLVPGLGVKTSSLGVPFLDLLKADTSAVDLWMIRKNYQRLKGENPDFAAKLEEMTGTLRKDKATGRMRPMSEEEAAIDIIGGSHKRPVYRPKTRGEGFPEDWKPGDVHPELDETMKAMSPETLAKVGAKEPELFKKPNPFYLRIMDYVDESRGENPELELFLEQWRLWDTYRGRIEPHEMAHPDWKKIPKQSWNEMFAAKEAHGEAGYLGDTRTPEGGVKPTKTMPWQKMYYGSAPPLAAGLYGGSTLLPDEQQPQAGVGSTLAKIPQKAFTRRIGPDPEKTVEGYRALRLFPSRPGETFPAMINQGLGARTPEGKHAIEGIPMGEWLQSEYMPAGAAAKGIKGRKGWHAGEVPTAPQFNLHSGAGAGMQPSNMVWSDVSLDATRDWQKEADKLGNPKSPYYRSELPVGEGPDGGFYRYRNKPNDSPWIISDAVRHNRIMTDEEVNDILRTTGLEPTPREGGAWTQERLRAAGLTAGVGGAAVGAGALIPTEDANAGIGGVLARNADLDMLKLAREAERTKLPPEKIYDATGWTRGADDNWKFEIDDSKTKFKDRKLNDTRMVVGPARSVAKGSDMLDQYPDLGNVRVKWEQDPLKEKGYAEGYYQRVRDPLGGSNIERIEGKSNDDYKSIGHEFQHAIQRREGFARGGSPEEFYGPRVLAKNELESQIDVIHDKLPKAIGKPLYSKLMAKRDELLDKMEAEGLMSQEEMRLASFNDYRNLAGEVEARNVQKRMPLTPDERRMSPFPETEDVPRNQQILKYAPGGAVGVGGLTLAGSAEASPAPKASSGISAMARRYQADKEADKVVESLSQEQARGAAAGSYAARTHTPLSPAAGLSELKSAAVELANPINWAGLLAKAAVPSAAIEALIYSRELGMSDLYDPRTGEPREQQQNPDDEQTAEIMRLIREQLEGVQ